MFKVIFSVVDWEERITLKKSSFSKLVTLWKVLLSREDNLPTRPQVGLSPTKLAYVQFQVGRGQVRLEMKLYHVHFVVKFSKSQGWGEIDCKMHWVQFHPGYLAASELTLGRQDPPLLKNKYVLDILPSQYFTPGYSSSK